MTATQQSDIQLVIPTLRRTEVKLKYIEGNTLLVWSLDRVLVHFLNVHLVQMDKMKYTCAWIIHHCRRTIFWRFFLCKSLITNVYILTIIWNFLILLLHSDNTKDIGFSAFSFLLGEEGKPGWTFISSWRGIMHLACDKHV